MNIYLTRISNNTDRAFRDWRDKKGQLVTSDHQDLSDFRGHRGQSEYQVLLDKREKMVFRD
jgi:hypothetical protein